MDQDDEVEVLAEFRALFNLRTGKAPQYSELRSTDRVCHCAGKECGVLLLAQGTTAGRRRRSVPGEVHARVLDRPYCVLCVMKGSVVTEDHEEVVPVPRPWCDRRDRRRAGIDSPNEDPWYSVALRAGEDSDPGGG